MRCGWSEERCGKRQVPSSCLFRAVIRLGVDLVIEVNVEIFWGTYHLNGAGVGIGGENAVNQKLADDFEGASVIMLSMCIKLDAEANIADK